MQILQTKSVELQA